MSAKLTFNAWKSVVDAHIRSMCGGMSSDDLPDYRYRDAYDSNSHPKTVAIKAIKAAKKDMGL